MVNTTLPATSAGSKAEAQFDVVVVGAGFAGLYALHMLRKKGFSARLFEAGDGVGGTWYWNRYPGARCDIESIEYSYSFCDELQQEWDWPARYADQPEILRYINHVADRFDLRRDIQLETRVTAATWDEKQRRWTVTTDRGDEVVARYLISAAGCLSAGRVPDIKGLENFKGKWYHTGNWPHQPVDFIGQRVGVIGTGSSGIQAIPAIAKQAAQLTVFQRTPNFSIPAWNRPLSPEEQKAWKEKYLEYREQARKTRSGILYEYSLRGTFDVDEQERQREYERRWKRGGANYTHAFNDIFFNREANDQAAEYVRNKIRRIVKDPQVAAKLAPTDHAIGTKRICVDTDYYATFNLPHVSLVDLKANPIEEIVPTGIRTKDVTYDLDSIVFATGYDAVTGSLDRIAIRGRNGLALKQKWMEGPRTYLGIMTAGFPNLFFITGPGSPSVLTNVVVAIEQHVDWIARCLQSIRQRHLEVAEADADAENEWVAHVNEVADKTLFPTTASWYTGANVPGKPRVFLPYVGGLGKYTVICDQVAADGYRGIRLDPAPATTTGAAAAASA